MAKIDLPYTDFSDGIKMIIDINTYAFMIILLYIILLIITVVKDTNLIKIIKDKYEFKMTIYILLIILSTLLIYICFNLNNESILITLDSSFCKIYGKEKSCSLEIESWSSILQFNSGLMLALFSFTSKSYENDEKIELLQSKIGDSQSKSLGKSRKFDMIVSHSIYFAITAFNFYYIVIASIDKKHL